MQCSEIIVLPSQEKSASWLHGVPTQNFRVLNFHSIFRGYFIASTRHATHRNVNVDGRTIISWSCIAILTKKLDVSQDSEFQSTGCVPLPSVRAFEFFLSAFAFFLVLLVRMLFQGSVPFACTSKFHTLYT